MKKIYYIILYFLLGVFAMPNSVLSDEAAQYNKKNNTMTMCKDPRPQICTQDYRPVCGQRADASFQTYSNGCGACSDKNVKGYRDGVCEEGK